MSPSRGLFLSSTTKWRLVAPCYNTRALSSLSQLVTDEKRKIQVYISRTLDPYLNLSIEHFLLQRTPVESTILFLYTNRPCIVIGRNQNPWVEVNLGILENGPCSEGRPVDLVRRRSGGGTVFHDEGNVNYSVICPSGRFDRDKHANMVVRALQSLGVARAQVNERHDIILAGNQEKLPVPTEEPLAKPFKISGSAYKLTRLRALHHGTCLLSSPNIKTIGQYLRSPLKLYIKARGVDSVSSPITNVNIENNAFENAVVNEFCQMYSTVETVTVGADATKVSDINKGLKELKSLDWIYLQTPQFDFSTHATEDDPRSRPALDAQQKEHIKFSFTARNGAVTTAQFQGDTASEDSESVELEGKKVHEITDWRAVLSKFGELGTHLNRLFGRKK